MIDGCDIFLENPQARSERLGFLAPERGNKEPPAVGKSIQEKKSKREAGVFEVCFLRNWTYVILSMLSSPKSVSTVFLRFSE